jgi:hypothetical protein
VCQNASGKVLERANSRAALRLARRRQGTSYDLQDTGWVVLALVVLVLVALEVRTLVPMNARSMLPRTRYGACGTMRIRSNTGGGRRATQPHSSEMIFEWVGHICGQ